MTRQRTIAMRTSFYRYAGLWRSGHVSFQIRRTIFQSVINGAALSGCEPYVFSTTQWEQLESEKNESAQTSLCKRSLQPH